ncbi:MAG: FAD-dependent monooxygenase [Pseudomonadota bacterium]
MSSGPRIAVIGAGIGGAALALALARSGRKVKVYEQAPELREVGAGISLSPNAVKGLRYLGIGAAVDAAADEPPVQLTRHFQTGEILVNIDRSNAREEFGAPYLQMHRADLHTLITESLLAIDSGSIELGKRFQSVDGDISGYRLEFADGSRAGADLVVGADGLKSRLRENVFGESAPEFSGFIAWRGLLPTAALGDYELPEGSAVFVARGRLFVRYPVRRGRLQNFVAFSMADEWSAEGWSQTGPAELLRDMFADFHAEVTTLLGRYEQQRVHKWGLFARQPLPEWVRGRITVLGDAAHPMLPWFGQGAATSIEDAVVLARALTEIDDVDDALRRYEAGRRERVTRVHEESLLGGQRLLAQDPMALARKPVKTEDTLGLTQYDPATVAL